MTFFSLIGALVFLAVGIVELALVNRIVYPALRWRYEQAKTTQSQGIAPSRIMTLVKIQSLIAMPVIGLFFGDRMKAILG
jgi:hypothetical protein